jgi:hypothetical protein
LGELALNKTFLILTESVFSDVYFTRDITPIQNPAIFLHPIHTSKTEAGLFTQDLFDKVEDCARGVGADLPSTL